MSDDKIAIRRPTVPIPDFVTNAAASQRSPEIKYPSQIIPLPTKGWFYTSENPLSSGEIEIKEMTAKEEDILANQSLIKSGKVLDKLLESVILNKSIKLEEILIPDKNAIFIGIRRSAYGDRYPVIITCPSCNHKNRVDINLGEIKYKEIDFDKFSKGSNVFSFILPHSSMEITYKILSQVDEQAIDVEISNLKKISKENSSEVTTRLKHIITSINGNSDKSTIRKFVDTQLTAKDSLALREYMKENNPDVDMTFDFKCLECDYEKREVVPIGASFLWPGIE